MVSPGAASFGRIKPVISSTVGGFGVVEEVDAGHEVAPVEAEIGRRAALLDLAAALEGRASRP